MATHRATLLLAAGVNTFKYREWSWVGVGSTQVIGDAAKTYLLANRSGWFSYEVEDAEADIPNAEYEDSTTLKPAERINVRRILSSSTDVNAPLQIPRVADEAARTALTVDDGDIVYQINTDDVWVRANGAWVVMISQTRLSLAFAAGTFAAPTVADAAARNALVGPVDGTVVYVADVDQYHVRANGAWVALISQTSLTAALAAGAFAAPAVANNAARDALGAVANGTVVYVTDTHKLHVRANGAWEVISSA